MKETEKNKQNQEEIKAKLGLKNEECMGIIDKAQKVIKKLNEDAEEM